MSGGHEYVSLDLRNPADALLPYLSGQNGKDFDMIEKEKALHRRVHIRTIVAAIAMFAGIVLMGFGYYQNNQVMMYAGGAIILCGVMAEAVLRVLQRPQN